jgi:hypothetical protein
VLAFIFVPRRSLFIAKKDGDGDRRRIDTGFCTPSGSDIYVSGDSDGFSPSPDDGGGSEGGGSDGGEIVGRAMTALLLGRLKAAAPA